nr:ORF in ori [Salmonella enterica subsp. enterica serovar Panama]
MSRKRQRLRCLMVGDKRNIQRFARACEVAT